MTKSSKIRPPNEKMPVAAPSRAAPRGPIVESGSPWPYRRERLPGGHTVESGSPAVAPQRAAPRWSYRRERLLDGRTIESGSRWLGRRERLPSGWTVDGRTAESGFPAAGMSRANPRRLHCRERIIGGLTVESDLPVVIP